MKKIVTLSEEDRAELVKLYKGAQTTTVLVYSTSPRIRDTASDAWEHVRRKMDELGKKYGYDPQKVQINNKTGEVFPR